MTKVCNHFQHEKDKILNEWNSVLCCRKIDGIVRLRFKLDLFKLKHIMNQVVVIKNSIIILLQNELCKYLTCGLENLFVFNIFILDKSFSILQIWSVIYIYIYKFTHPNFEYIILRTIAKTYSMKWRGNYRVW